MSITLTKRPICCLLVVYERRGLSMAGIVPSARELALVFVCHCRTKCFSCVSWSIYLYSLSLSWLSTRNLLLLFICQQQQQSDELVWIIWLFYDCLWDYQTLLTVCYHAVVVVTYRSTDLYSLCDHNKSLSLWRSSCIPFLTLIVSSYQRSCVSVISNVWRHDAPRRR